MQEAICTMHRDPRGADWLREGLIDRFLAIADEQYQDIREMFISVQDAGFQL
jgi:hypothetical protein